MNRSIEYTCFPFFTDELFRRSVANDSYYKTGTQNFQQDISALCGLQRYDRVANECLSTFQRVQGRITSLKKRRVCRCSNPSGVAPLPDYPDGMPTLIRNNILKSVIRRRERSKSRQSANLPAKKSGLAKAYKKIWKKLTKASKVKKNDGTQINKDQPQQSTSSAPDEPASATEYDVSEHQRIKKELHDLKEQIRCPICLEESKNVVFLCGHGTCSRCSDKIRNCPVCRGPIIIRIPKY